MSAGETVTVRRRWSDSLSAVIPLETLWEFHFRNDAGGVCGAFPRAFLAAHLWCDKVPSGTLGHLCREGPPPHELLVCILPNDNPGPLYDSLRSKVRR